MKKAKKAREANAMAAAVDDALVECNAKHKKALVERDTKHKKALSAAGEIHKAALAESENLLKQARETNESWKVMTSEPCTEGYMTDDEMRIANRFFLAGYNAGMRDGYPSPCTESLLNARCSIAYHRFCEIEQHM